MQLDDVLAALTSLRLSQATREVDLQQTVADCLTRADIPFVREARLGPRARIDFLTTDGVGIEIKKGRPAPKALIHQLQRYAQYESVNIIVVVTERQIRLPEFILGKKCIELGTNRLWGVAL
jgi:CRISPR/Cas system-associated exonuclease Cas4 (RecB family)